MLLSEQTPENLEIVELTNRYFDVEQDHDKRIELIEGIADLGTQNALYFSGALFQEIAVDPRITTEDRRDSFNEAKNLWELAVEDWDQELPNPSILYSALGLAVMNNTVRVSSKIAIQSGSSNSLGLYEKITDVAEKALDVRHKYNLLVDKPNAVCTVNMLNHLMTLMLLQRRATSNPDFNYLAVPSQISQNRRLIDPALSAISWDTSLYRMNDGKQPKLINKIQSRTSIKAESTLHDNGILVVNNGKVLALDKREYKKEMKSFEVVEALVNEVRHGGIQNLGSNRTLTARTNRLITAVM